MGYVIYLGYLMLKRSSWQKSHEKIAIVMLAISNSIF